MHACIYMMYICIYMQIMSILELCICIESQLFNKQEFMEHSPNSPALGALRDR